MIDGFPDYTNLDLSGDVPQAAARMDARAREDASGAMFAQLVAPLLSAGVSTVLEVGCGTAALSRRIARAAPGACVCATDKSEGMLAAARRTVASEGIANVRLAQWNALDAPAFPFDVGRFDLIVSSVVVPYFDDGQTAGIVRTLASRLSSGGVLAFVEQDLATDTVNFPDAGLRRRVMDKDSRPLKRTLALGLRPLLRDAGLTVLPRRSFLWTDDAYGPYTRDLLAGMADAACKSGRLRPGEREEWTRVLQELADSGDFFYGMVYHLVAGRRR